VVVQSRRVSFATPIYHQELADDIDRRSPVIRTSSPRSKVLSGQSKVCDKCFEMIRSRCKTVLELFLHFFHGLLNVFIQYITTPTKGYSGLSPRNLRSPGSKSSKKCLVRVLLQCTKIFHSVYFNLMQSTYSNHLFIKFKAIKTM